MAMTTDTPGGFGPVNRALREAYLPRIYQLAGDGILGASFEELVSELGDAVHFSRPQDPILVLLWASQSWLGPDVLPERCLAYLAFTGPKSSGKSTATEIACALAGGTMISG